MSTHDNNGNAVEEEDVDWNNNQNQQQQSHNHNEEIDPEHFDHLQQEATRAATSSQQPLPSMNNNNNNTTSDHQNNNNKQPPAGSANGTNSNNNNNRRPMSVPVASLAGGALSTNSSPNSSPLQSGSNYQPPINNLTAKKSQQQQLSNALLDSSRRITTRERQREREYKKTLMQQEKGNADVDYSNWESGNAPDAMSLRVATAVTELIRDAFANVTAMRREIRQRNVDALANGSALSEEAGRAVREAMQSSLYPLSTGLVNMLEEGLRSVMPLFSSSMRNTEGLTTLVQIRDQLHLESRADVNAAQPSSSSSSSTSMQKREVPPPPPQLPSFIPLPPTTSQPLDHSGDGRSNKNTRHVSRLDSHPVYDREQESDNHMQYAIVSARSTSSNQNNNSNYRNVKGGGSTMNTMPGTLSQPILTTLSQVEAKITENAEVWPADHRRHQAHSTLHHKIHPTKAEAAKRVNEVKNRLMHDHSVESVIPPVLNKLILASLPRSARLLVGTSTSTSTKLESGTSGGDGTCTATGGTTASVAEMKKLFKERQNATTSSSGADSPNLSARKKSHQLRNHDDVMARYPINTVDGFAARILSLHDPTLSGGIWRQLSVNEKQQVIAFEQRENRYHHLHGVTNMKLAGLRMKMRRSQKSGIELAAGDYAALADAERRKKILEEQRASDVRQTGLVVKSWLPPMPERFEAMSK